MQTEEYNEIIVRLYEIRNTLDNFNFPDARLRINATIQMLEDRRMISRKEEE